ncbi:ATP-binding Cassette (ABC) Superfamily [Pseudoloma neurophilia]|uniref:ATP-binding Cassette (ABC) Superfamily n=1 Tax=Pseudoloma neurophilia TaxID=146866 RepID=A0A0R0LXG2_9MICR|nr:ATP-binding Cassette (ABC) Superfamily [Pseudoloma neurophilia]
MSTISGGERKRVMIAVELISEPKILFLDEPTSGLDSNISRKLLGFLKSLSNNGMIVIITIHQPSEVMLKEFDKIILLSRGKTVFFGDLKDCEPYLINNQFEKKEGEAFSDFSMRILDTEKKEHHEFIPRLDKMANEMKNIHSAYIKNQNHFTSQTKKNIVFSENKINMRHVLLIFKRKFKTRKLSKLGNIAIIIYNLILTVGITAFFCYYKITAKASVASTGHNIVNNVLKNKKSFENNIKDYTARLYVVISIMLAQITSTLLSSNAFLDEMDAIKRELGVSTYSLISYTLATVLFESSIVSFNLPFFCIASYCISGTFLTACLMILLTLLTFITLILFNLLLGPIGNKFNSLMNNQKVTNTLGYSILIFFCMIPFWISYFLLSGCGKNLPYFLLNFLCPAYTSFFLYYTVLLEVYAKINVLDEDAEQLKKSIGKCLTFFEINPKFGFIILIAWIFFSFFMLVGLLKRFISPRIRLKLHA